MSTTSDIAAGEWKNIQIAMHLKGRRRDPKYFPAIGETCRMSGPNCDDAEGYTWTEVEVLWSDDLFVVTRHKDCWPNVTKHELALFEPAACPLLIEAREIVVAKNHHRGLEDYVEGVKRGAHDKGLEMSIALAALRRGIEIGSPVPSQIEEGLA